MRLTARDLMEAYGQAVGRMNALVRVQTVLKRNAREEGPYQSLWQSQAENQEEKIARAHQKTQSFARQIEHALSRLPDPAQVQALTLRYLRLLPFHDIGEVMGYSERHVYRLIQKGLRSLDSLRGPGRDEEAGR